MSKEEDEFYGYIPMDNLPRFVREVAEKYQYQPKWKGCFKNAFMLGWMLEDEGHSVHYCEATCKESISGIPYEHAWLRVNGKDINVSSNGEPITVLTNSCFRMAVIPIAWLRSPDSMDKYAGMSLTGWEFREDAEIQKWVSPVQSQQLTEHISWEFMEGYPDYSVCGAGENPEDVDLFWESKVERQQLAAKWVNVRNIMDAVALSMTQQLALLGAQEVSDA